MRDRTTGGAANGPPHLPGAGVVTAHRFVEHGGEVELELDAATEAGVFEAAFEAFVELVAEDGQGEAVGREIELTGRERALLLVDWLHELLFLAEVEELVPERLAAFELGADRLRATVAGHRGQPRPLVKAVTLNSLEFEQREGIWHGRVVLDI